MFTFEDPFSRNALGKKGERENQAFLEGSKNENERLEDEEFKPEDALREEDVSLKRGRSSGRKGVRALATAFILLTAVRCSKEGLKDRYQEDRSSVPQISHQEKSAKPPETKIVKRKFSGYGIQAEQTVEVDRDGNVIRVLESKIPYGREK